MDAHTLDNLFLDGAGLLVLAWAVRRTSKTLATLVAALGSVAVLFVGLWLLARGLVRLITLIFTHWRLSLTVAAVVATHHWAGWPPW